MDLDKGCLETIINQVLTTAYRMDTVGKPFTTKEHGVSDAKRRKESTQSMRYVTRDPEVDEEALLDRMVITPLAGSRSLGYARIAIQAVFQVLVLHNFRIA